jgi:ATP-binding cassette subfamily B protein
MLLAIGFSRLTPWFLKLAIDTLETEGMSRRVYAYVGIMLGAAVIGGLFLYLQRWLIIGTSRRIEYQLKTDLFQHVQSLDISFFGQRKTGDLMAHFTNDLNAVRDVAGPGIMYSTQTVVILVSSITIMMIINPFLTLVGFAPYPLISLVTYFYGKKLYARSREVQDQFATISAQAQEDMSGVRVIRSYVQEEPTARVFHTMNHEYLEANMRVARLRAIFLASMTGLAGLGLAITLFVGGRQVVNGQLSLGSLVAFTAYLGELTWPVIAVGWVMGMVQRGASAMGRLQAPLRARPTLLSGPVEGRPAPHLAFESVTFRYPGAEVDALQNVSFEVHPRQTLGIVGRTGSGKSTLLQLILRFYDPTSGVIRLDGIDIRERDLGDVRATMGYAPQDGFLFSRTLADNVAYGRPGSDDASVERATKRAALAPEIGAFPRGLETLVGERGVTLSGGQRQRASLARAILLDPELLLLDDTLSAVDAETEEIILDELKQIMGERTSVIVSHRISAVQNADHILVLDDGRVVQEGRHEALIATEGLYARLYERQRLAEEVAAIRVSKRQA